MNKNKVTNYRFNWRNFRSKKVITFASLLFMLLLFFSLFDSMFYGGFSFFVQGIETPHKTVKNETELINAIKTAFSNKTSYIIGLSTDINLENSLEIPLNKNITLVNMNGFWNLYGANKQYTIVVTGFLTLDGICITHTNDTIGGGIHVKEGGTLVMLNGSILDNMYTTDLYDHADYNNSDIMGGGVSIDLGGSFVMSGGVISRNNAYFGGGVCNRGIFTMTGGTITDNIANDGGGVCNFGLFSMSGGRITGNTAKSTGGGLYYRKGYFKWHSGKVLGNTVNGKNNDLSRMPDIFTTPPYHNYFWSDSGVWMGKIRNNLLFSITIVAVGFTVVISLLFYRSKRFQNICKS